MNVVSADAPKVVCDERKCTKNDGRMYKNKKQPRKRVEFSMVEINRTQRKRVFKERVVMKKT